MIDDGRLVRERLVGRRGHWGLGRAHLGTLQPAPQLRDGARLQVLFHGDLENAPDIRGELAREPRPDDGALDTAADLVGALYRRLGSGFPARLRGAFVTAVVDEEAGRLVLGTDAVGSYPLYWLHAPGCLVFASELKAVLRHPALKPALNPRALADYLELGILTGEKTLAEGVSLVPPGSALTYDWEGDEVRLSTYCRLDDAFGRRSGGRPEYVSRVIEAFRSAVERSLAGPHRFGMSLSGGLDSRTVLSAVGDTRTDLATYTLGVKGCADEVIAEKLAKTAGTRHRFFELDERYLKDFLPNLRRMVSLTDGMYVSQGLTEMLALRFLEELDISVLLRGHGGELLKTRLAWPFHTDEGIHGMRSSAEFVPYLLARLQGLHGSVPLSELLAEPWHEATRGQARRSLEESVAGLTLSPPELASYLYLREYHRRHSVPSIELFRSVVEVRLPFLDQAFLEVCLGAPSLWREGTELHRALIGSLRPGFLRVRNSNTGAPAGAGPVTEAVLDRVNGLLRRLNVHGYRHYHHFDAWMSRMLVEGVEEMLLSGDALDRGIYREATLRRLVDETRRGNGRHSYLLQAMLVLELWQQEVL
jgi:asparagine synthase (glutamine-hydrolysing)